MSRRRYQRGQLVLIRGRWFGRFYLDTIENGMVRRHRPQVLLGSTKDLPTRRLAQRALDRHLTGINATSYRPRPIITFREFSGKWQVSVVSQLKASTIQNYRIHLEKHLIPAFGPHRLNDLDPEIVQRFVSGLKVSPKTVRNIIATFRSLWRSARAWGYVAHNIFDGLVYPARNHAQRFFFSVEDVRRIVQAATEPHKTFYGLLSETGLRVGELCGLTVNDIDLERGLLFVRQSVWRGKIVPPKTANAVRAINLSPQCVEHLRQFLTSWRPNENKLLFATRNNTPWNPSMLRKRRFRSLLKSLNIQVPRGNAFHAFRHANAVLLDQISAPMKLRQQRLGHSDASITLGTYTHVTSQDSVAVAAQLGSIVWGQEPEILDARWTQNENGLASNAR